MKGNHMLNQNEKNAIKTDVTDTIMGNLIEDGYAPVMVTEGIYVNVNGADVVIKAVVKKKFDKDAEVTAYGEKVEAKNVREAGWAAKKAEKAAKAKAKADAKESE